MDYIEQYVIDKVLNLRLQKKLSQKELGDILNVSSSFIGNVESLNNPAKYNLKHIAMLSTYFKLTPKFFIPTSILDY